MSHNKARATYDYGVIDGIVWIIDLDGGVSVTNDIENVVAGIFHEEGIKHCPVVYQDSMGNWDGWDQSTQDFIALQVKTREEALKKIMTKWVNE